MAHTIAQQTNGRYSIVNESGVVVDEDFETIEAAQGALDEIEADDAELERTGAVNRLKPGSRCLARAEAAELAFDRKLAEDAALGSKVLEARGIKANWTDVEKRVAKKDLEDRMATEQDWKVEAAKRLADTDPTLDGHASHDEWLAAARKRCAEVEVELRSSTLPGSHFGVSNLSEVATRPV